MNMSATEQPAIVEAVYRYAQYLDSRDWDAMAALFDGEIDMDFRDLTGNDPARVPAAGFTSFAAGALEGITTQHIIANPKVSQSGEEATCIADHQSMHHREIGGEAAFFNLHGTYEIGLRRRESGWKIASMRQTISFTVGDGRVMDPAAK